MNSTSFPRSWFWP